MDCLAILSLIEIPRAARLGTFARHLRRAQLGVVHHRVQHEAVGLAAVADASPTRKAVLKAGWCAAVAMGVMYGVGVTTLGLMDSANPSPFVMLTKHPSNHYLMPAGLLQTWEWSANRFDNLGGGVQRVTWTTSGLRRRGAASASSAGAVSSHVSVSAPAVASASGESPPFALDHVPCRPSRSR